LRLLLRHWLELRGDEAMPRRSAIAPSAMAPALPYIWICEYLAAERRFRMRLAGEEINRIYGRNVSHSDFEEIIAGDRLAEVTSHYRRVLEQPAILHCTGQIYLASGRAVVGERLALPLRDEDGTASQIIGASVYDVPRLPDGADRLREEMTYKFTPLYDD
jgi:hypothetical protein